MKKYRFRRQHSICLITLAVFTVGLIYALIVLNVEAILASILGMILAFIGPIINKLFKVKMSWVIEAAIQLFMIGGIGLGIVVDLYGRTEFWDLIMHAYSGFLVGMVAFSLIYCLIKDTNVKRKYLFSIVGAVAISLSVALLWEVFEFSMDSIFGSNWQRWDVISENPRDALLNTMWDMIVCLIGTVVFACISIPLKKDSFLTNGFTITKQDEKQLE